jgi:hypothetical protein
MRLAELTKPKICPSASAGRPSASNMLNATWYDKVMSEYGRYCRNKGIQSHPRSARLKRSTRTDAAVTVHWPVFKDWVGPSLENQKSRGAIHPGRTGVAFYICIAVFAMFQILVPDVLCQIYESLGMPDLGKYVLLSHDSRILIYSYPSVQIWILHV